MRDSREQFGSLTKCWVATGLAVLDVDSLSLSGVGNRPSKQVKLSALSVSVTEKGQFDGIISQKLEVVTYVATAVAVRASSVAKMENCIFAERSVD